MKKYSAIVENGYADLVPDDNGDVVHASVAQALYDALCESKKWIDCSNSIDLLIKIGNEQAIAYKNIVDKALSLADGEE